uniref:Uncharacterized protein n=1 Tax=Micrurus lemniscatus lemniscatus TaxID=129467 RepID=A0A2D4J2H4_MICLE
MEKQHGETAIRVQVSGGGTSSEQTGFLFQGTRKGMDVRAMKEYCLLVQKRLILYPREEVGWESDPNRYCHQPNMVRFRFRDASAWVKNDCQFLGVRILRAIVICI